MAQTFDLNVEKALGTGRHAFYISQAPFNPTPGNPVDANADNAIKPDSVMRLGPG